MKAFIIITILRAKVEMEFCAGQILVRSVIGDILCDRAVTSAHCAAQSVGREKSKLVSLVSSGSSGGGGGAN